MRSELKQIGRCDRELSFLLSAIHIYILRSLSTLVQSKCVHSQRVRLQIVAYVKLKTRVEMNNDFKTV
jgi:hypothetical protein